jgi:hypothetical protein
MTFAVLVAGGPIERWLHRLLGGKEARPEQTASAVPPTDRSAT